MTPLQTRTSSPTSFASTEKIDQGHALHHDYNRKSSHDEKLIPFVSKLTLQQSLPFIYSAFGDGANLYVDVLGLDSSKKEALSSARLRLAYFRKGREVLASPVEVDDEITTLTYQGISASQAFAATTNKPKVAIRSGVPISRKAKKRFQAICLAYEVLSDHQTRTEYDALLKQQQYYGPRQSSFTYKGHSKSSTKLDTIIERINSVPKSKLSGKSHLSTQYLRDERSLSSLNDVFLSRDEVSTSDPGLSKSFSTTSSGFDSILRPTNAQKLRKSDTPTRIRWNEQVEELVIMDYDAQNEHFTLPDVQFEKKAVQTVQHTERKTSQFKDKKQRQPVGKHSKQNSSAISLNPDDEDDVWSSSHPFFPEQDVDIPFDESACFGASKNNNIIRSRAYPKNSGYVNRPRNDEWLDSDYDDQDESSMDETGSVSRCRLSRSLRDSALDNDLEGKEDDCGVPFSFDLAAGFQVALSKYLGNVLSEMKTGLSELGKTFSDINVNQKQAPYQDKCGGNKFFMDEYEVNALMSVLRSEMNQETVNT